MTELNRNWKIETFDSEVHDREKFSCGVPSLDEYFKNFASQDVKRKVARLYVSVDEDTDAIAGYYSLSATSFNKSSMPKKFSKRLPNYPVPAVLLGRLAVDSSYQNCGLGSKLLVDAFKKVVQVDAIIGVVALLVDALDMDVVSFYQKSEFVQSDDNELRLFIPMTKIQNSFD